MPACFREVRRGRQRQIEANELKVTLQSMGQNPTDEEIFEMLSSVDEDGSSCYREPNAR